MSRDCFRVVEKLRFGSEITLVVLLSFRKVQYEMPETFYTKFICKHRLMYESFFFVGITNLISQPFLLIRISKGILDLDLIVKGS